MNINNLPRRANDDPTLHDLVFTDINDSADNPRLGLGYHQLYDPEAKVGLIAKLPNVSRVGDTITLYWNGTQVQEYTLDAGLIEKGWLSFGVLPMFIPDPEGEVYYTLYDHQSNDLQTSAIRSIAVKRLSPGGLDPNPVTAINEGLALCTVNPNPITNSSLPVTVIVPRWMYQVIGDELTVMWNNIRVDHPKLQTVGPITVTIPKDVIEQGGSSEKLMVNYEIRDIVDNYSLVSPPTYVMVEIDPNALAPPEVIDADITTLVLDLEKLGERDARVAIPSYSGNGKGYVVTLSWVGKTPLADISLNLPPKRVDDLQPAEFAIPNAHMKQIAGGSAVVRYSLLQDEALDEKTSKTTTITITGLLVQLAEPVVLEANGTDVIDLAQITGSNVTVSIAAYVGQSAGDKVLLTWKGTPVQGAPVNYSSEYEIKAGEELRAITFLVNRENLDPLSDGVLELRYQVIFKATGNTQNSLTMNYSVKAIPLGPVMGDESFERQSLGLLPLNTPVSLSHNLVMTITLATGSSMVTPNINEFGNVALYCAGGSKFKFEFSGTINILLISHALTFGVQNRLEFFNAADVMVNSFNFGKIPDGSDTLNESFRLNSPCVRAELTVDPGGALIDNLVWL